MIDRIKTIMNPLTIIAIFAAIAEISGTIVLPRLGIQEQSIFLWFVIIFPILLVILFFLTLNLNHKVLYAPSDYKDESNFLKINYSHSKKDRREKLDSEIELMTAKTSNAIIDGTTKNTLSPESKEQELLHQISQESYRTSYMLAQDLVLREIEREFSAPIYRQAVIGDEHRFHFDGFLIRKGDIYGIGVKFVNNGVQNFGLLNELIEAGDSGSEYARKNGVQFVLIIAVVSDGNDDHRKTIEEKVSDMLTDQQYHVWFRFFDFDNLKNAYGIK